MIEAEQALLGAMLLNGNVAFHKISSFLRQEHFGNAVHGRNLPGNWRSGRARRGGRSPAYLQHARQ